MNLEKLFQMQQKLDDHIMDEHPELKDQDNLDWKILALQVELGECANEWRGFKKWKKDRSPNTKIEHLCPHCTNGVYTDPWGNTETCDSCFGDYELGTSNPLLEEYVDCLHFILSIGLERNFDFRYVEPVTDQEGDITEQFNNLFSKIGDFKRYKTIGNYIAIGCLFTGLGEMLGFTWDQIEQAYFDKNEINHQRQEAGY